MLLRDKVVVRELDHNEIDDTLLDHFNRYQEVERCWRKNHGQWELVDHPFIEDWGSEKKQQVIHEMYACSRQGGIVLGAFVDDILIGFSSLGMTLFGSHGQYIELVMMQVSCEYRGKGIGKRLFSATAEKAKEQGAEKLYISAHSSEESQAFYRAVGCVEAQEINSHLADLEPFDCQMEFNLGSI